MDVKKLILTELKRKKKIATSDIVKKTGFSRAYAHRFLKGLQDEGKINLIGRANSSFYVLTGRGFVSKETVFSRTLSNGKNLVEDVILTDIKKERPAIFKGLPKNIADIFDYTFTEILNNAIEHSASKRIFVNVQRGQKDIGFQVFDWGVGVFNNIKKKFKLKSPAEAIEHLLKGKQTTLPQAHSGKGLFFTSRLADVLTLKSFGKKMIFDNKINDIFVGDLKQSAKGTKVAFNISLGSKKTIRKVFQKYADKNFFFSKTDFKVKILGLGAGSYISRSEARRLLFGLNKFRHLTLDFKKVDAIGHGFADEVFRVWQKNHPKVTINHINANESVKLMIKRALSAFE